MLKIIDMNVFTILNLEMKMMMTLVIPQMKKMKIKMTLKKSKVEMNMLKKNEIIERDLKTLLFFVCGLNSQIIHTQIIHIYTIIS